MEVYDVSKGLFSDLCPDVSHLLSVTPGYPVSFLLFFVSFLIPCLFDENRGTLWD